jgi:hypothetical protein
MTENAPTEKHAEHPHHHRKTTLSTLNACLLVALLVVLAYGAYAVFSVHQTVSNFKPAEPPRIAQLALTVVEAPLCAECLDADTFTGAVAQLPLTNVTTTVVQHNSIEGQKLIKDYALAKLPAAIVTGETENVTIPGFAEQDGAFVFTDVPPPYYDLKTAAVTGIVDVTFITDKSCKECLPIEEFGKQMEQVGVTVGTTASLDFTDKTAQDLIKRYSITKVPAMILTDDALLYEPVQQVWDNIGTQESDGMLVLRNISPPYRELSTRQVRGLVTLTSLVDATCAECYNVSMHQVVLEQSFGMKFKDIKKLDIASATGAQLVTKYGITQVPSFVMDKEAAAYSAVPIAWAEVGTQESDGAFVFRKVDLLQGVTFKDLTTGELRNATGE